LAGPSRLDPGKFQAKMEVAHMNSGPVTLILDCHG
jgi:D-Tyr-tRNAtyr deacylase